MCLPTASILSRSLKPHFYLQLRSSPPHLSAKNCDDMTTSHTRNYNSSFLTRVKVANPHAQMTGQVQPTIIF